MTDSQKWLLFGGLLAFGWLLYLLAPVLTPFGIGALLAYLGDPLVDRLEARRLSRTLGVIVVFGIVFLLFLILLLILVPMLERQLALFVQKLPQVLIWLQQQVMPHITAITGIETQALDAQAVKTALFGHWKQLGGVLGHVLTTLSSSGQVVIGWLAWIVLVPVVSFYLLRDWDILVAHLRELLPRRHEGTVVKLLAECDAVLAEFLRGQLLVMLALATIYTLGLWIAGLDLALLIGLLAGVVSFVPYLGVIVGLLVAGIAVLMQYHDLLHLFYVLAVFGVGQALEGMLLSPLLVGERIGLHPVAVIFAVMAGGQLFGFLGVLLALPAAAVIMVLLRHSRELYLESGFYTP